MEPEAPKVKSITWNGLKGKQYTLSKDAIMVVLPNNIVAVVFDNMTRLSRET